MNQGDDIAGASDDAADGARLAGCGGGADVVGPGARATIAANYQLGEVSAYQASLGSKGGDRDSAIHNLESHFEAIRSCWIRIMINKSCTHVAYRVLGQECSLVMTRSCISRPISRMTGAAAVGQRGSLVQMTGQAVRLGLGTNDASHGLARVNWVASDSGCVVAGSTLTDMGAENFCKTSDIMTSGAQSARCALG